MYFTAVGDALIQRRLPGEYEGFNQIKQYIEKGDFRFFNLETTLNEGECYASQYCGGSYLRYTPKVLDDLKAYGFNTVSICNNHIMDYSYEGLLSTLKSVKDSGLIQAGVGENMSEAAAPSYLETLNGRVAYIGVTSSFNAAAKAGYQSRRVKGRPGVNGMRYDEIYEIDAEHMKSLREIAEMTKINGRNQLRRNEGYLDESQKNEFDFKELRFVEGNNPGRVSIIDEKEFSRIAKSLEGAKRQADYVVVSIHNHQVRNGVKEEPDFFIEEFAHRCIDLGAHAIIGHGPHILRGIEIYKGCPIMYSLGNFIFQNENIEYGPEDFYDTYGLNSDSTMEELFYKRSDGFKKGLQTKQETFESIIPFWEMKDGKLVSMQFMPISLGEKGNIKANGWPEPSKDDSIGERMCELSKRFGTKIRKENGCWIVEV